MRFHPENIQKKYFENSVCKEHDFDEVALNYVFKTML